MLIEKALEILYVSLVMGLVFFIFNSAIRNARFRIKGLINLIVGLTISLVFIVAFVIDYNGDGILNYFNNLIYIVVTLIYSLGFSFYFFRYGKSNPFLNRKVETTSKYYFKEFIYLVYRYKTDLYLVKNKNSYQGYIIKLKKTDFYDEIIREFNKKNQIVTNNDLKKLGTVTLKDKKQLYHCFIIDILEDLDIKGFEQINGYRVLDSSIDDFNKRIIYRLFLREAFEIEL